MLLLIIITGFWFFTKLVQHHPFIASTFPYWPHAVGILGLVLVWLFYFYFFRLVTAINEQGIFVRWTPLKKKYQMFLWEDMQEVSLVKRPSIGERRQFADFYFTGSACGIQIVSRSGRKKFISTGKEHSLPRILSRMSPTKFKSTGVGEHIDFRD